MKANINEKKLEACQMVLNGASRYSLYNLLKDEDISEELRIAAKRQLRKIYKEMPDDELGKFERVVSFTDDGDLLTREIIEADSKEQAEEIFEEYYRMRCHSPYDCSGERFTMWHRIVKQCGKYVLYHQTGIDC